MLKIKISPLHNSEPINIGKTLYTIERVNEVSWIFRKADSKIIIRRHTDKNLLKEFASSYCKTHNAELYIKDESGSTMEILQF